MQRTNKNRSRQVQDQSAGIISTFSCDNIYVHNAFCKTYAYHTFLSLLYEYRSNALSTLVSRMLTKICYLRYQRCGRQEAHMVKTWMLTVPRNGDWCTTQSVCRMIQENDVKKWTIGFEEGKNGYRHYQIRLVSSNHDFFEWCKINLPTAHIEEATEESGNYERKSGNFLSSDDTAEIRQVRFGVLRESQKKILEEVNDQGDREIDVYFDPRGNNGKTWLTIHLYERGRALVVPRANTTAEKLSAYICSSYNGEEYVIIDIPRSRKITPEIYEAIEEIKDGLVFDSRYSGRSRNIRGVKLIIFTNKRLDLTKLSNDRWRLHAISTTTKRPMKTDYVPSDDDTAPDGAKAVD
ncbi:replication associated protein [Alces alces faeces associated smacovirus MP78]|uniref:Replication associated protein n=1 Tax=Alces alces faeces associated smacovirus MP78 TaxID=2219142 RepID=A0A2Z5CHR4_9VIRU|nr:replication associated protein [Alces alces faeces associated smacovirus MP78]AXB22596.1 replication associated protein [Alces alces faeces associated smacovirus MP78]